MKLHIHIPHTEKELWIEGLLLVKVAVMVGIIASYFLPPTHAIMVSAATNMLWLWKT